MSWRTVVITKRCKLDYSLGYLEIRDEGLLQIHLTEVHTLMVETTAVSLTGALLCELMKRKIKVIFCDDKRMPQSELVPYYGAYDCVAKLRQQMKWHDETKGSVWAEIIRGKIDNQQALLRLAGQGERADQLTQYKQDIQFADASNREGHAAKVYFGGLFGQDFTRTLDCPVNAALNYGYSLLLSMFSREIVNRGYLTQLGIFHDNMFNPFNLASDLMEPFRPLVDHLVWKIQPETLDAEYKRYLLSLYDMSVTIEENRQQLSRAVYIYCCSVIAAMNERDVEELRFFIPPYAESDPSALERQAEHAFHEE